MSADVAEFARPYFQVSLATGEPVTEGDTDVLLGHRIVDGAEPSGGNWVEWHWDGQEVAISNDLFGAYPVYYAASESAFAISPSIDRLLALGVDRQLDLDALAAFLTAGHHYGTDTSFRAIRSLPPASRLTWRQGSLSIESSPPTFERVDMTREQAAEGVTALMRQAIARRIPDAQADYMMPLSGGRDSRHILLELLRQGHRPRLCVTAEHFPFDWGGDGPYAARLAAELGLEHVVVSPGSPLAAEQRKNRLLSYGSTMHAWFLSVVDAMDGRTSYTYEGLPGGSILERRFVTRRVREFADGGRWDELAAHIGKKLDGRPGYLSLLAPEVRARLPAERGVARIRAELERHLHADDPFMSFRIWNRTMRELTLTPNAMLSEIPAVYTPYMDSDFMAFGMSIPPKHIDRAFHDDLLAAAYPEVAHVPFRPLRRPRPGRGYLRLLNRELWRLLWRESDGSLVDRPALMKRAAAGAMRGDDWFTQGRRFSQLAYLVQLEGITRRADGSSQP